MKKRPYAIGLLFSLGLVAIITIILTMAFYSYFISKHVPQILLGATLIYFVGVLVGAACATYGFEEIDEDIKKVSISKQELKNVD